MPSGERQPLVANPSAVRKTGRIDVIGRFIMERLNPDLHRVPFSGARRSIDNSRHGVIFVD